MRVLLFTGKGGVGKTTLASATAALCAQHGRRTLVLSADPAHSLGDVLDSEVGGEAVCIGENLFAQEVDASMELERHWGAIRDFLVRMFESQGVDHLRASELAILPGFDEIVSLLAVRDALEAGEYDVVILDCAPTAATLRLLGLPDAARWYMERVFPVQKRVVPAVAPAASKIVGAPLPRRAVFRAIEQFYEAIRDVGRFLADPIRTSVRLVTNPEAVVVRETQRSFTALNLWGYGVDGVIVNKSLEPETAGSETAGSWLQERAAEQARHRRALDDAFWFLPLHTASWQPVGVVGVEPLAQLGADVYGDVDPSRQLTTRPPMTIRRKGSEYEIAVPVPKGRAKKIDVFARDGELVIARGKARHNVLLPRALVGMDPRARLAGDQLVVTFARH